MASSLSFTACGALWTVIRKSTSFPKLLVHRAWSCAAVVLTSVKRYSRISFHRLRPPIMAVLALANSGKRFKIVMTAWAAVSSENEGRDIMRSISGTAQIGDFTRLMKRKCRKAAFNMLFMFKQFGKIESDDQSLVQPRALVWRYHHGPPT